MAYIVISFDGEEIARQNLKGTTLIGRALECDISVHDHLMSRKHCRLQCSKGQWTAVDLASRNGTQMDGKRIDKRRLADGDTLKVGNTSVTFRTGVAPALRLTARKQVRAADPVEALAGTVFAFQLSDKAATPQPATLNGRPAPKPAPLAPPSYEREGVGAMVIEMLSDLHDTVMCQAPRIHERPKPKPSVPGRIPPIKPVMRSVPPPRPVLEPSPITDAGAALPSPALEPSALSAVSTSVARSAVTVSSGVTGDSVLPARPTTPQEAITASLLADAVREVSARPSRRSRQRIATLDLCMVGLLIGLFAILIVSVRALFLLHA